MKGAYQVERSDDVFEPVNARNYFFRDGGVLHLTDEYGRLVVAYAQGQWLTVHYDHDYVWDSRMTTEDARQAIRKRGQK